MTDEATPQQVADAFVEIITRGTPIFEAQISDSRALAAPAGDEDVLELLFDDLEGGLDELTQLIEESAAGDLTALDRLDSGEFDPFGDVDRRANQYGLTECGEQ